VSFPVEPSLRLKLAKAGVTVSDEKDAPDTVVLHVDYREEQGAPLTVGLYGTVLVCKMTWEPGNGQAPFHLAIQESSTEALGNAPYVEAVLMLETNPYFFFFGDIMRGTLLAAQDVTGGLIAGLQRQVQDEEAKPLFPVDPFPNPADTLPAPDELHSRKAKERTIDELGRLKDPRAAGVLTALLSHPRPLIRVKAVTALAALGLPASRDAIRALADRDPDPDVRAAAHTALGLGVAAPVP
jgi:hypothetical protein